MWNVLDEAERMEEFPYLKLKADLVRGVGGEFGCQRESSDMFESVLRWEGW